MTRKLIAFASAAALIAGVGACKDAGDAGNRTSTTQSPSGTSPQGRRADTPPRTRGADAGSDVSTTPSATPPASPSGPAGTSGSSDTSGTSSSGSTSGSTSGSGSGTDTKR